jgi:hypothetical protein
MSPAGDIAIKFSSLLLLPLALPFFFSRLFFFFHVFIFCAQAKACYF